MNNEQMKQIVGIESAYKEAKSALGIPRNVMVSNQLIIDMHDTILAQAEEIEKLRKSVTQLIDAGNGLIENSGQLSVAHHQAKSWWHRAKFQAMTKPKGEDE